MFSARSMRGDRALSAGAATRPGTRSWRVRLDVRGRYSQRPRQWPRTWRHRLSCAMPGITTKTDNDGPGDQAGCRPAGDEHNAPHADAVRVPGRRAGHGGLHR